jgi:hypothetical protein
MKFHITPSYEPAIRLWLETTELYTEDELNLFIAFSSLSIWGGKDKSGRNYASWEFDPKMEPAIRKLLLHHNRYEEGDFKLQQHTPSY